MKFNITIQESNGTIVQKILSALKDDVTKVISSVLPKITNDVKELVDYFILDKENQIVKHTDYHLYDKSPMSYWVNQIDFYFSLEFLHKHF